MSEFMLDPPSNKKGIYGFTNDSPEQNDPSIASQASSSLDDLLKEVINIRRDALRSEVDGQKIEIIRDFILGHSDDQTNEARQSSARPRNFEPPKGMPTVDELINQASLNGGQVIIEDFVPMAGDGPINSTRLKNTESSKRFSKAKETLANHKKATVVMAASAILLTGTVVANNNIEGGLLTKLPVIGKMFEKPVPPTQQELNSLADQLSRKTTIEKPLIGKPLAISTAEAPATEPEISLAVNYTTKDQNGQQLTLANGVRMAAVNPYLQINYSYNKSQLKNSIVYNEQNQKVSLSPSALNLQLLLLAPPQEDSAVNAGTPEFAYRIAGGVGDNEAILEILKKQNKDFGPKEIKLFMDSLADPGNESAISNQITSETFKQLLLDPIFLDQLTNTVNEKIAADIEQLNPNISYQPIQLDPDTINKITESTISKYGQTALTDGLSLGSGIKGLSVPSQLNQS
jgi:hypothetical protein